MKNNRRMYFAVKLFLAVPFLLCSRLDQAKTMDAAQIEAASSMIQFNRAPVGRTEDWQYVLSLAQKAFEVWTAEGSLTGPAQIRAYDVRTDLFHAAASEAAAWQVRYFPDNTGPAVHIHPPFEPGYAYVTFVRALFIEDSEDYWKAKPVFMTVLGVCSELTAGSQIPTYNGQRIDSLAFAELQRINNTLAQIGTVTPYDRSNHFQMSVANDNTKFAVARDFVAGEPSAISHLGQAPSVSAPLGHLQVNIPSSR